MMVHPRMAEAFRAQAAVAAMQGLLAWRGLDSQGDPDAAIARMARASVKMADALVAELKKPKPTEVPS